MLVQRGDGRGDLIGPDRHAAEPGAKRFDEDGGVAQIGRGADFGYRDRHALHGVVVDVFFAQNLN